MFSFYMARHTKADRGSKKSSYAQYLGNDAFTRDRVVCAILSRFAREKEGVE